MVSSHAFLAFLTLHVASVQTFYVFNEQVASELQLRKLLQETNERSAIDAEQIDLSSHMMEHGIT